MVKLVEPAGISIHRLMVWPALNTNVASAFVPSLVTLHAPGVSTSAFVAASVPVQVISVPLPTIRTLVIALLPAVTVRVGYGTAALPPFVSATTVAAVPVNVNRSPARLVKDAPGIEVHAAVKRPPR
jgi:hypothetical protein